ncbi:hypothetical protein LLH06_05875 [Mucilaginibacter daejeonensis]|uniref:hypothetical protein n=1 Tax=Mucilaginibacter daejeonensis TaxID=398049 RepID=UPI001D1779AC|nr:hypothetical protein [Mucilaginibacter daejeonensis]UEG54490.1 hypothetical protein LLH06_05875 [Mucilaginibacter daejeonensis]
MHPYCKRSILLVIPAIMLVAMFMGSCKKNADLSYVNTFLTNGTWTLASLQVATYNGDTLKKTDTLNLNCNERQQFIFDKSGMCTYENFYCIKQTESANWTITDRDSVIIRTNIALLDDINGVKIRPFAYTQVVNLGQNSLVLQTVKRDTLRLRPLLIRRRVSRYGFLH